VLRSFVAGIQGAVLTADAVFQITEPGQPRRVRPIGHAGIAAVSKATHSFGERVVVYHMGAFVEKQIWSDGEHEDLAASPQLIRCSVDVLGTFVEMEQATRDDVVREALKVFSLRPSVTRPRSCYWAGDPAPASHPLHPAASQAYAFSCTTFVDHCYRAAGIVLVDSRDLPFITDDERRLLYSFGLPTQATPFRRLVCGHLLCAFEGEMMRLPFKPADGAWTRCSDDAVFRRLVGSIARSS
jgi:hypothetical protein